MRINLGAGSEPAEGWINTDWLQLEGIDKVFNLLDFPWPFEDGVADEMKAIDVLEHMPVISPSNEATAIKFIEECHRILKVGGTLTIQVPHHQSPNLWIDPTHIRGYDVRSFDYFDPDTDIGSAYGYYSECKFDIATSLSRIVGDPEHNGEPSNVTFSMVKR